MAPVPRRSGPIRLELELRSDDERIQGRIIDSHGTSVPFSGWLEFIAVIQALTNPRPHSVQDESGRGTE